MDIETLAHAQNDGYDTYKKNGSMSPWLSATIQKLVEFLPVGAGAVEVFQAFTDGYNMAADEECARILAEV